MTVTFVGHKFGAVFSKDVKHTFTNVSALTAIQPNQPAGPGIVGMARYGLTIVYVVDSDSIEVSHGS